MKASHKMAPGEEYTERVYRNGLLYVLYQYVDTEGRYFEWVDKTEEACRAARRQWEEGYPTEGYPVHEFLEKEEQKAWTS